MCKTLNGLQLQKQPEANTKTNTTSSSATNDSFNEDSPSPEMASKWRTYTSPRPALGFENILTKTVPSLLSMGFMFFADLYLKGLLYRNDCVSANNYRDYIELSFTCPYLKTLVQLDTFLDSVEGVEQVFTWIPTVSVLMGRRATYCSTSRKSPFFKMSAVTNDDGKFSNLLVTVFRSRDMLRIDLDREIEFYLNRKGAFRSNTDILENFPSLNIPKDIL